MVPIAPSFSTSATCRFRGLRRLLDLVRDAACPLTGSSADYDDLLKFFGDAQLRAAGEASRGTHEFYPARSVIWRRHSALWRSTWLLKIGLCPTRIRRRWCGRTIPTLATRARRKWAEPENGISDNLSGNSMARRTAGIDRRVGRGRTGGEVSFRSVNGLNRLRDQCGSLLFR